MANFAMPAALGSNPTSDDPFTAAYREYAPMVRRIILSKLSTRDYDLADDLTQNTFLALFRYRDRLDLDRDPGGLLSVMAKQSISHHFRTMRNTREVPADMGHWAYANRNLTPAASGAMEPVSTGFRTASIGGAR